MTSLTYRNIITKHLGLALIPLTTASVLSACSGQSELNPEIEVQEYSQNESPAATAQAEFTLSAAADRNPPYVFALVDAKKSIDGLRLIVLEETENPKGSKQRTVLMINGEPADFKITLTSSQGHRLQHPKALLAVRDRSDEGLQRVFIVFEGAANDGSVHAVSEVLVNLKDLDKGGLSVETGRVFSLPVRGSLGGVRLSAGPQDSQLTVSVAALAGDPSQPVTLIYNIAAGSGVLDPIDVLMVPLN